MCERDLLIIHKNIHLNIRIKEIDTSNNQIYRVHYEHLIKYINSDIPDKIEFCVKM